jgi:hypothetical protein
MAWGRSDSMPFNPLGPEDATRSETVELVGPNLRVRGEISLLNFTRLSDLINHSRGFVRLRNTQLLRRNGEPSNLVVAELMVNQDEITFVGQRAQDTTTAPSGSVGPMDRPVMQRVPRQLVVFAGSYTLTGAIHAFAETDIATFVDTPDPRFVALVDVKARSLSDQRYVSTYGLVLVNRTQITAASFLEKAGGADETGVAVE